MEFVSNRNIVIRSKFGHAIEFVKGEPTYVPPAIRELVMEKGILPVDGEGKPVDPAENEVVVTPPRILLAPDDGDELEAAVLVVIKAIVARNNADDFAGGGHPSARAVTASLGYKVDQKTVKKVWEANREAILNPSKE